MVMMEHKNDAAKLEYLVSATQTTYLTTIVDASSREEAKEIARADNNLEWHERWGIVVQKAIYDVEEL